MGRKYFGLAACAIGMLIFLFGFAGNIQAQLCSSDDDCDDGMFCNGIETCVGGYCAAVSACPPAVYGCVTRGYSCDEVNDICVDFADDSLCEVGQICDVTTGFCLDVTCGIAQLIAQEAVASGGPYKTHGQKVNTAAQSINEYLYAGMISEECHSCIVSQFASRIPIEEQESCGPIVITCSDNTGCTSGNYCKKAVANCDGQGICVAKPLVCADIWDPVCGCDFMTYGNDCEAAANGASIAYLGECSI